MTPTAFRTDVRRGGEVQGWRNVRSHHTMITSRVAADDFSPKALAYAMPMAGLLWLAALSIAYPFL